MSPLALIVVIVLVDLIGFTMVMPLLGPFAQDYGFSGLQIGMIQAAYPLCQLVSGPILGRLSDRHGRRPVLIASQAGTAISFLILGLTRDFRWMVLARALDGASGGNILVAQAYVADVTKPEQRSRGLGLIGAAFGVGFVIGPLLAGLVLKLPVSAEWRLRLPFLVAAGFSSAALLLVWLRLPESRAGDAASGRTAARVASWRGLVQTVTMPRVGSLVGLGALLILAFAALEATFSLFVRERMHWGTERAAYAFAALGLIGAIVQGGLIRGLVRRHGEPTLIVAGLAATALGFVALALTTNVATLLVAAVIVSLGRGLAGPTIAGLLSRITPEDRQGAVFGAATSAQTLARLVNYLGANVLLARYGPSAPFWEASLVATVALLWSLRVVIGSPTRSMLESAPVENAAVL